MKRYTRIKPKGGGQLSAQSDGGGEKTGRP